VVRPGAFPRLELVEAAAQQAGAETLADGRAQVTKTGAVVLRVPLVLVEQVEDVDDVDATQWSNGGSRRPQ
jgi:hypothetical protein